MTDQQESGGVDTNDWAKVHAALSDPTWDFRSVKGISRATGLDSECVQRLLDEHPSEVRQTWSRKRHRIYTLRSRPRRVREILADIQRFASKSF